jgi:hypothetical protein
MSMPWAAEVCDQLDDYFKRFLVPYLIDLEVNGSVIAARPTANEISTSFTTEIYYTTTQSWKKPCRKSTVQLVNAWLDETPAIYEMVIPMPPVEWTMVFHCDVQQRVLMNPTVMRSSLAIPSNSTPPACQPWWIRCSQKQSKRIGLARLDGNAMKPFNAKSLTRLLASTLPVLFQRWVNTNLMRMPAN